MEDKVVYSKDEIAECREADISDVFGISINCDNNCVRDIKQAHGRNSSIAESIAECFKYSEIKQTVTLNGRPIFMFGVVNKDDWEKGCGYIWLVITPDISKIGVTVTRRAKKHIKDLLQKYKELVTYVDTTNTIAMRWIKAIGFKQYGIVHYENGEPYSLFKISEV